MKDKRVVMWCIIVFFLMENDCFLERDLYAKLFDFEKVECFIMCVINEVQVV